MKWNIFKIYRLYSGKIGISCHNEGRFVINSDFAHSYIQPTPIFDMSNYFDVSRNSITLSADQINIDVRSLSISSNQLNINVGSIFVNGKEIKL